MEIHSAVEQYQRVRSSVKNCLCDLEDIIEDLASDLRTVEKAKSLAAELDTAQVAADRIEETTEVPRVTIREARALVTCLGHLLENGFLTDDGPLEERLQLALDSFSTAYNLAREEQSPATSMHHTTMANLVVALIADTAGELMQSVPQALIPRLLVSIGQQLGSG